MKLRKIPSLEDGRQHLAKWTTPLCPFATLSLSLSLPLFLIQHWNEFNFLLRQRLMLEVFQLQTLKQTLKAGWEWRQKVFLYFSFLNIINQLAEAEDEATPSTTRKSTGPFKSNWTGLSAGWPDWTIYCTLGIFSKPVATIILPKSPNLTFLT